MLKKLIISTLILTSLAGCGSIPQKLANAITPDNIERTELLIKVAASQYIQAGDPEEFAQRAKDTQEQVQNFLDGLEAAESTPIALLEGEFKDQIKFSSLTVADQILVQALIDNVVTQLELGQDNAILKPDTTVAIKQILNIVLETATLYAVGA